MLIEKLLKLKLVLTEFLLELVEGNDAKVIAPVIAGVLPKGIIVTDDDDDDDDDEEDDDENDDDDGIDDDDDDDTLLLMIIS